MKTLLYGIVVIVVVVVLLSVASESGLVVEDLLPEAGAEEALYQTDPDNGLSKLALDGLRSYDTSSSIPEPARTYAREVVDLPKVSAPDTTNEVKSEPDEPARAVEVPRDTTFEELSLFYAGVSPRSLLNLNPNVDPDAVSAGETVLLPEEAEWNSVAAAAVESAYNIKDASGEQVAAAVGVVKESIRRNPDADHEAVLANYREAIAAANAAQRAAQRAEHAANVGDTQAALEYQAETAQALADAKAAADATAIEATRIEIDTKLAPVSEWLKLFQVNPNPVPKAQPEPTQQTVKASAAAPEIQPRSEQQAQALSALDCGMPTPNDWAEAGSDPFKLAALAQQAEEAKACMNQ